MPHFLLDTFLSNGKNDYPCFLCMENSLRNFLCLLIGLAV